MVVGGVGWETSNECTPASCAGLGRRCAELGGGLGRTGLRSNASLSIESLQSKAAAAETELARSDTSPAESTRLGVSIPGNQRSEKEEEKEPVRGGPS